MVTLQPLKEQILIEKGKIIKINRNKLNVKTIKPFVEIGNSYNHFLSNDCWIKLKFAFDGDLKNKQVCSYSRLSENCTILKNAFCRMKIKEIINSLDNGYCEAIQDINPYSFDESPKKIKKKIIDTDNVYFEKLIIKK